MFSIIRKILQQTNNLLNGQQQRSSSLLIIDKFCRHLHSATLYHNNNQRHHNNNNNNKLFEHESMNNNELPEFSGMKAKFITELKFLDRCDENDSIRPFRILDVDGTFVAKQYEKQLDIDLMKRFYREIVRLNQMDDILNQAQRQGRISFYMTSYGEEATHFGPAAALSDKDWLFGQYREPGVLLWRGFTYEQFISQCFGNNQDLGKGRQMPIHYGSRDLNYVTIKSSLATGLPHAVGAAYGFKLTQQDRVSFAYFGEGAASEGDAHAAFNFAATLQCPVIFFCRNNGYAISTPTKEQYHGDGIVVRGPALGIPSIRVDGNDILACYYVVKEARRICIQESRPALIEAMTYRLSHHSTSDDSSVYRSDVEVKSWKESSHPLNRIEKLLRRYDAFNEQEEKEWRNKHRKEMINLIDRLEKLPKVPIREMFTDVYDQMPEYLHEQHQELMEHLQKYHQHYPQLTNFMDDKK
ncbi:hypothetical protein DERF_015791 [Dermatophagoides farinae]|uniref:2-oxoisovalerate dehydrogenase subunit alpha n=1 Tax=Dermatophagoides farinae TaxID=6954 RepID=A0A922HJQ5_DERFA|nr:hypothetical protein DERF_015791 [Dermatophagoides farinae]